MTWYDLDEQMNRRSFTQWLTSLGVARLLGMSEVAVAHPPGQPAQALPTRDKAEQQHLAAMERHASWGAGPKVVIGMLVILACSCRIWWDH